MIAGSVYRDDNQKLFCADCGHNPEHGLEGTGATAFANNSHINAVHKEIWVIPVTQPS
jgi:hypothetical protein